MPDYKPGVPHYARSKIEPIDFMEACSTPEEYRGYLKNTIIKYAGRLGRKGRAVDDAEKILVFAIWLKEHEEKQVLREEHLRDMDREG